MGYLNDISNLEILEKDVYYSSKIKKDFHNFTQYIKLLKIVMMMMIFLLLIHIQVLKIFMMLMNYFVVNLKLNTKKIVIVIVIVINYSFKSYNLIIRL